MLKALVRTLIEGYRIFPGEHCGSVAMRGLLSHYCGLELPESAVFGLGAGVECLYLAGPAIDPPRLVFGRTATLEVDVGAALQVDYREQTEDDDARAWQVVRDEVLAGRPTMLSGDILYLDYREYKVHFPGHRFVLLGFDDATERAFIADRIRPEPEACSYAALARSRNPPEGMSTRNLWGRFHGVEPGRSLPDAARWAIGRCARSMLGGDGGDGAIDFGAGTTATRGVAAIRRLAEELPTWGVREDAGWIASYNARCIEKFGNGGGNFRRLYAGFLSWARELEAALVPASAPALATRAADGWTAASAALGAAGESGAQAAGWREAAARLAEVAEVERELFERLGEAAAGGAD